MDWDAPTTNNGAAPTGYVIERSTSESSGFTAIESNYTGGTQYDDNDAALVGGTTYYYKVYAINTYGTSAASNTANAVASDVPAQVTGLTITSSATTNLILDWTAPSAQGSAITGYKVERSPNGTTGWTTEAANEQDTDFTDAPLTSNILYYYKVSAINAFGTGAPSTITNAPPLPTAPATLTLTVLTLAQESVQGAIQLDWTDPSGDQESGYHIEWSLTGTVYYTHLTLPTTPYV